MKKSTLLELLERGKKVAEVTLLELHEMTRKEQDAFWRVQELKGRTFRLKPFSPISGLYAIADGRPVSGDSNRSTAPLPIS